MNLITVFGIFFLFLQICKSKQPNVVLIVADDLGWNDVGFHGSNQIPTPNIDALAYNGVILNRFYTQTSCSPSRAALLTGQYPIRLGFQGVPLTAGQNRYLPPTVVTLPQKLKELGYKNYLIGKWHLGSAFKNVTPTALGFDYHYGYWNGYIGYFNHYAEGHNSSGIGITLSGLDMHKNLQPVTSTQGEYATSLFTKQTEKILNEHDDNTPFFLTLAHLAPHSGHKDSLEVPDVSANAKEFSYITNPLRQLYAGMVSELDKSVGQVMKVLAKKGILDNTIVIFIADNGAQTVGVHENFGSNWPLRGLKFTVHEGGVRNVGVIYSSRLKNNGVNNELMHISDLMPTIYAAAGGNLANLEPIDGVNQWDTLINNAQSNRNETLLNIDEINHSAGLIGGNGRYKLINVFAKGNAKTKNVGYYPTPHKICYIIFVGSQKLGGVYQKMTYAFRGLLKCPNLHDRSYINKNSFKMYPGSTVFKGYDLYFGESGRGFTNPSYNISAVLDSDTNKALKGNLTKAIIEDIRHAAELKNCRTHEPLEVCSPNNFCLFDLHSDPCETTNIALKKPKILNKLKKRLEDYWSHIMPQPIVSVDSKANPANCNNMWFTWMDKEVTEEGCKVIM